MNYGSSKSTEILLSKSINFLCQKSCQKFSVMTTKKWCFKKNGLLKNDVDFWHRKLTLKVQFRHFVTNHNSSQDCFKTISFEHIDPWAKLLHFRTHHLQYSTTELTLKVGFRHFLTNHNSLQDCFKTRMLILGQNSCILGPTIFEIPLLN